jgi:WD40 repeat protein
MGYPAIISASSQNLTARLCACWLAVLISGLAACSRIPQQVIPATAAQPIPATKTASLLPLSEEPTPPNSTVAPPTASPTSLASPTAPYIPLRISPDNASLLEQVGVIQYDPWDLVLGLAWTSEGDLLAVAAGNSIYLYAGEDLQPVARLEVGAWTTGLAFSPDSRSLAAGSQDGELRIWHRASVGQNFVGQPGIQWTAHKKGINQLAFSPDGNYLASGGNDAIARVWNAGDGHLEQQMIGGTFSVPALAFQPNGEYIAVVNGSLARLREFESGRIGTTLRADAPLLSLDFSPDGQWIATGNLNAQLEIWEAASGTQATRLDSPGLGGSAPQAFIKQVVYSPDGSLLGSASSDGSINIWEAAHTRLVVTLVGHSRAATSLAFNSGQTRLASGGLDAAVRIWGIP